MLVFRRKVEETVFSTFGTSTRTMTVLALDDSKVQIGISATLKLSVDDGQKQLPDGDRQGSFQTTEQGTSTGFVFSGAVGQRVFFLLESHVITLHVLALEGFRVKIGIEAPPEVSILRAEVLKRRASMPPGESEPGKTTRR